MADISKTYLDLHGFLRYHGELKTYISGEDAKSYKTILQSGNTINFYKKENATSSDTADFSVNLGTISAESYIPSFDDTNKALVFTVGSISSSS